MDLFTVQRYEDHDIGDHQNENMLETLVQKIEKRKIKLEKSYNKKDDTISKVKENKEHTTYTEESSKETNEIIETDKVQNSSSSDTQFQDQSNSKNYINKFRVLGNDLFQKKQETNMILPSWLAFPTIVTNNIGDDDTITPISELKFLSLGIKEALSELEIKKLFPIQNEIIPWIIDSHSKSQILRPRDICVSAPTGSGKTLAFAIPIVQILSKEVERKVRALIVLPSNELALQVYRVFRKLISKTKLSACLLSKSLPLNEEQQKLVEYYNNKYYSKVDIVITTPGRLVEHIHSTKGFYLNNLKFLVIDEADKIMDQIHHNWLYYLDNHVRNVSDILLSEKFTPLCVNDVKTTIYNQPHKMLFSATLSQDPEKLRNLSLFQPKLFITLSISKEEFLSKLNERNNNNKIRSNERNDELMPRDIIAKYTTPIELSEKYCITENHLKPLTLYSLIVENSWKKFICFTNSAESANRLSFILKKLFKDESIREISANLKTSERTEIINLFIIGKIKGLVSSDALARGIDVPNIDIVISYEIPRHIKTYIHRIGRTARAGRSGTAITLLSAKEFDIFNKTLATAGKEILDEIKVESDIETENARRYSNILKGLKKEIERKKKIRTLHKILITKKALPSIEQKSKPMNLMERLQIQASEIVADQLKQTITQQQKQSNKRRKLENTEGS